MDSTNAKPMSREEARAFVAGLVREGGLTEHQASLFDFRESTEMEKAVGEEVGRRHQTRCEERARLAALVEAGRIPAKVAAQIDKNFPLA